MVKISALPRRRNMGKLSFSQAWASLSTAKGEPCENPRPRSPHLFRPQTGLRLSAGRHSALMQRHFRHSSAAYPMPPCGGTHTEAFLKSLPPLPPVLFLETSIIAPSPKNASMPGRVSHPSPPQDKRNAPRLRNRKAKLPDTSRAHEKIFPSLFWILRKGEPE